MSHVANIELYVNDPAQLLTLCQEVLGRLGDTRESNTAAMEAQLREISRTIDRLTKLNVPVPEVLRAEKLAWQWR